MKILKYLFFLILIALIAGAVYVATKEGEYELEESSIIQAPVPVVFTEVNNLNNWENWAPWLTNEEVVTTYSDTLSGEGAAFSWTGEDVANGSILTTKVIPDSTIEQDLRLKYSFAETDSDLTWKFEETGEGTKLSWRMTGNQTFREKLQFLFKDSSYTAIMRPKLQEGLEKMRKVVTEKMEVYSISVDGVTTHGGGFYLYTTTVSNINQIQTRMQQMFADVSAYMEANNIPQQGDPFILYNQWNEQNNTAIYSAGIFTPNLVITPTESSIVSGSMPAQEVVKTTLKGDYKYLTEAWDRAYAYIEASNLQVAEGQSFEVYRVRPKDTANPANWLTEIYIPVRTAEVIE